jgi:hypothetical protein
MPIAARVLIVLAIAAVAGCSWTEPKPDLTLEETRELPGPAPYFLGETFEGLPLSAIFGPHSTVWFVYGDCEVLGEDELGCREEPALSVEVWPESIAFSASPCRKVEVRGAPGALYRDRVEALDYNAIQLYIGSRTITIAAGSPDEILRAAHALRTVEESAPSADPLPAPSIDAEAELAHCTER